MWYLIHHFYVDLWIPIWPNLAASGVCFSLAFWRTKVHLRRHHDALKEHMTNILKNSTEGRAR